MQIRLSLLAGAVAFLSACDSGGPFAGEPSFSFARADTIDLAHDYPRSVFAADFDGDGDDDLLVAHANDVGLTLLRNDGDAHFDAVAQPFDDFTGSWQTAIVDLDGDGDLDLAVATTLSTGEFLLFQNDGTGQFSLTTLYPGEGGAVSGSVPGDFDGDGDVDLAAVARDASWLLVNDGSGLFRTEALHANHRLSPNLLVAGDMDGGGTADILTEGGDPVSLLLLSNDGAARFTTTRLPTVSFITGGVLTDVDGDGYSDLVVASPAGLARYPGGPNGPAPYQSFSTVHARDPHRADFDGDGVDEVAAWEGGSNGRIAAFAWNGARLVRAGEVAVPNLHAAHHADVFAVGDFDGDGWDDVALCVLDGEYTRARVLVYLNAGPRLDLR